MRILEALVAPPPSSVPYLIGQVKVCLSEAERFTPFSYCSQYTRYNKHVSIYQYISILYLFSMYIFILISLYLYNFLSLLFIYFYTSLSLYFSIYILIYISIYLSIHL